MKPKNKKRIVKLTIPRIVTDNPMACFSTRDGSWIQEVPISSNIIKFMKGKHEAYFELITSPTKIISMKPIAEALYYKKEDDGKLPDPTDLR